MGYIRHDALVVTTIVRNWAELARSEARRLGLSCSEAADDTLNGYVTFAVFPDGSKWGWSKREDADEARHAFKTWLRAQGAADLFFDWVHVRFGGDANRADVIGHADEDGTE